MNNEGYYFLFLITAALIFSTLIITLGFCGAAAEESNCITIAGFTSELMQKVNAIEAPLDSSAAIQEAEALGIMEENEYGESRWNERITRQTAAKLVGRTLSKVLNEPEAINDAKQNIPDYNDICHSCRPYVSLLYAKGILQGYADKSFGGSNYLTPTEKDLIFERLTNKEKRITR